MPLEMLPLASKALLLVNAAVLVFQTMIARRATLALWPPGTGFPPWQLITCGFLRGNLAHLTVNLGQVVVLDRRQRVRTWISYPRLGPDAGVGPQAKRLVGGRTAFPTRLRRMCVALRICLPGRNRNGEVAAGCRWFRVG